MALFHVPGWSMNTAPVSEQSSRSSKKRKRPCSRSITLDSAEVNFEKLVATLKDVKSDGNTSPAKKKQNKKRRISEDAKHNSTPSINQKPLSSPPILKNSSATFLKPNTNKQGKRKQDDTSSISASLEPRRASGTRLTALQKGMKQSLDGARFR